MSQTSSSSVQDPKYQESIKAVEKTLAELRGCPDAEREQAILASRAPEVSDQLSREVVAFVQRLRDEDLFKKPGVAETIDWAKCLVSLDALELAPDVITDTMGALLKYQDDIARFQGSEAKKLLDDVRMSMEQA